MWAALSWERFCELSQGQPCGGAFMQRGPEVPRLAPATGTPLPQQDSGDPRKEVKETQLPSWFLSAKSWGLAQESQSFFFVLLVQDLVWVETQQSERLKHVRRGTLEPTGDMSPRHLPHFFQLHFGGHLLCAQLS